MDLSNLPPSAYDNLPALTPPPGVVPNFDNPESLAPAGKIVFCVMLPVMAIIVYVRLYTRVCRTRAVGADDYLCIAGTAAVISYCGVALSLFGKGYLGPHQWNVRLIVINLDYIRCSVVVTVLYGAASIFIKTSLLVQYLRIFRPSKMAAIMIWMGIAVITVFYLAAIITTVVSCDFYKWPPTSNPIAFAEQQAKSGCNRPQLRLSSVQGVFSTVSDVYVLAVPTLLISSLHLSVMRRVGIIALFLVGLIATGCSIVTVVFRFEQLHSNDFSWYSSINMIFGGVELIAGVTCSCLPVAFVTFKSGTIASWTVLSRYAGTLRHRPSGSFTARGEQKLIVSDNAVNAHADLPKIPRATITGLRSLLRGTRQGQPTELSELTTYNELQSIDVDYHSHLKSDQSSVPPSSRGGVAKTTSS
ncbi:hypothetical protein F5B19DRAFT_468842 [Rostrohypoxylon terebratum]|nr:hypothetical protein F5B19DRAFT_468842 [Rostrohypoxylon terebratum]